MKDFDIELIFLLEAMGLRPIASGHVPKALTSV